MVTVALEQIEPPLILAIDIGTSSVRALLFDRLGRAVEGIEARQTYPLHTSLEGASEADPDSLLERVWKCVDGVLTASGDRAAHIGGVAMSSLVSNLLGVDSTGRAVTPLTTYADTRAAREVAELRAVCDETIIHDRTGCHFHPSYFPVRFRWLARTQPDLFSRVARWVSIGEYLELQLFGDTAVSYSVASWTGLLNRHRLGWDESLLSLLPIGIGHLSPLTDITVPHRGLRSAFATRWPALRAAPWFPAVGDGAAANIGSGCVSPTQVALTVGTSAALRVVIPTTIERVPPGLWCYRVDRRRSLLGGALSEGGNVFAWLQETLHLPDPGTLEAALSDMAPDTHGLTVLPFLAGERSPGWASHARATIHGISLATSPLDLMRAGLEAVACRISLVFDLLQSVLPEDVQIVASGGALLSSPAWLQIMADALGRSVAASQVQEASARGAALLALEVLGLLEDEAAAQPSLGAIYEPDAERHACYRKAMERQQTLYEKLVERDPHFGSQ